MNLRKPRQTALNENSFLYLPGNSSSDFLIRSNNTQQQFMQRSSLINQDMGKLAYFPECPLP